MYARTLGAAVLQGQTRYVYVRELAAGAFGFVQLAEDHDGSLVRALLLFLRAVCQVLLIAK